MSTVKGTSLSLIEGWVRAIEADVKKNRLYRSRKNRDCLYVTPLNKARLLALYEIFHIRDNDDDDSVANYLVAEKTKTAIKKSENKVLAYLKTIRKLLHFTEDADISSLTKELKKEE